LELLYGVANRRLSLRALVATSGLPSTYAVTFSTLTTIVAMEQGLWSPVFVVTLVFSGIVLHDVIRVRGSVDRGGQTALLVAEHLDNDGLIAEQYRGIRPAPGYPACPEHTEKGLLWDLLDVKQRAGIWLTEAYAMVPTAAVSGFYFAHPESRYFAVGKINRSQVEDYARRKGMSVREAERWLAPNLGYDPE